MLNSILKNGNITIIQF